jgi:hypothetical protein
MVAEKLQRDHKSIKEDVSHAIDLFFSGSREGDADTEGPAEPGVHITSRLGMECRSVWRVGRERGALV